MHGADLLLPYVPEAPPASPDQFEQLTVRILRRLGVGAGLHDPLFGAGHHDPLFGAGHRDPRAVLRAFLTARAPGPLPADVVPLLDALLGGERSQRPVVEVMDLPDDVWLGDITTLRADAIVNAANSAMLGCFQPSHRCVDNVIHAAAGPRLRADCAARRSSHGTTMITRGYHLPSRFVLHTAGPIVDGPLSQHHELALADAYRSCLDLAASVDAVRTVAFCSISTGLYGFPRVPAARIALDTTAAWLAAHPGRLDRVVFDVFSPDDLAVYNRERTRA